MASYLEAFGLIVLAVHTLFALAVFGPGTESKRTSTYNTAQFVLRVAHLRAAEPEGSGVDVDQRARQKTNGA